MELKSLIGKFTIYQYMSAFLLILLFASAFFYGFGVSSLIPVLITVITAALLDSLINYYKSKTLEFPYSAFISGLFIGGLLTQGLQWYVYVSAGAIAVLSKHLIIVHGRHIFNPANFGVFAVFLLFNASNTWWTSSPFILVLIFGIFILWRMRRFDLTISFLAAYYIIHAIIEPQIMMGMPMMQMPMMMNNFYLSFISQSTIFFFAMFMLIEPKTHPASRRARIFYGILAAAMIIGVELKNPAFGLPFVLLIANMLVPVLNRIDVEVRKRSDIKQG
ncbi:RnfABCDGE type electron transport complex subunit D [Candidatus Woesearchaeota archaeon]|nr:RnfABCDGE type electron transport complex subunit D [Candidatus Woesearchaeota archaeon]